MNLCKPAHSFTNTTATAICLWLDLSAKSAMLIFILQPCPSQKQALLQDLTPWLFRIFLIKSSWAFLGNFQKQIRWKWLNSLVLLCINSCSKEVFMSQRVYFFQMLHLNISPTFFENQRTCTCSKSTLATLE